MECMVIRVLNVLNTSIPNLEIYVYKRDDLFLLFTPTHNGIGVMVVSMLASGTQDCGFAPGQSRWIFSGGKILSMPSLEGK
jgi:hypothetical protein